jgi:hypothetical protein
MTRVVLFADTPARPACPHSGAIEVAGRTRAALSRVTTLTASILDDLRRSNFRDLTGARVTAHVPVSPALLNRLVDAALQGTTAPVRRVDVRPLAGDRFEVVVSVKWTLVPPLTVTLTIEQQPILPDTPVLVLRWSLPAGLEAIASQFVAHIRSLPDGVRLDGNRILLDVARLAGRGPAADVWPYVSAAALHTTADAAVVDLELRT